MSDVPNEPRGLNSLQTNILASVLAGAAFFALIVAIALFLFKKAPPAPYEPRGRAGARAPERRPQPQHLAEEYPLGPFRMTARHQPLTDHIGPRANNGPGAINNGPRVAHDGPPRALNVPQPIGNNARANRARATYTVPEEQPQSLTVSTTIQSINEAAEGLTDAQVRQQHWDSVLEAPTTTVSFCLADNNASAAKDKPADGDVARAA
ncbi:hypothetical protein FDECE_2763 [Fusarium decemcellulare]|nr:hypothetical protein FDECE_2763 [Fusarium decemcellulare]